MGFGGGSPPPVQQPPPAEPVVPVPQEDDPRGIEEQKEVAREAKGRRGYEGGLLTPGGYKGDVSDPDVDRATLNGDLLK